MQTVDIPLLKMWVERQNVFITFSSMEWLIGEIATPSKWDASPLQVTHCKPSIA